MVHSQMGGDHVKVVLLLRFPLLVHVVVLHVDLELSDLTHLHVKLVPIIHTLLMMVFAKPALQEPLQMIQVQPNVSHVLVVTHSVVVHAVVVQSINIQMVEHVLLVLLEWYQEHNHVNVFLVL
jgi:hypothetical protein